jgi:uncharacterized membrane protein (UPF0127 family)
VNFEEAAARLDSDRGLWWLWAGVWVLFALAMGACIAKGADGPADPALQDSSRVPGFSEVAIEIDPADGGAEEFCALLADTEELKAQGMIGRSDFAGYDAMVFTYDADATGQYHMRGVPIGLSIAWFDAGGRYVSEAEMRACPDGAAECNVLYAATAPYRTALEAPSGGLGKLGVAPGSLLTVGGSCGG